MVLRWLVVFLVGCGRIAFAPTVDEARGSDASGSVDAPVPAARATNANPLDAVELW